MAAPTTMQDKLGTTWNVHGPSAGGNYSASLTMPAYGSQPGQDLVSASSVKVLLDEMNAYVDDYIKSGGKPPARGAMTVTASAVPFWVILLVVAYIADKKGR